MMRRPKVILYVTSSDTLEAYNTVILRTQQFTAISIMTYTIIHLLTRKPSLSLDEFKDHYENKHVPLVLECIKGVEPQSHVRYYLKRNDASKDEAGIAPPLVFAGDASTIDYDCITKIEFRDADHFRQFSHVAGNSPRLAEIEADQKAFVDMAKFRAFAVEEAMVTKP